MTYHYLMLNKPPGYLTGDEDILDRPTIYDLLPPAYQGVYPAGRLDLDSRGLLLLSNHGEFLNQIMHPACKVGKKYRVFVKGHVDRTILKQLKQGIPLREGLTQPAKVRILDSNKKGFLLEFCLWEGRKRQIRRMCHHCNLEVLDLYRFQIGGLKLKGLPAGHCRELSIQELHLLGFKA